MARFDVFPNPGQHQGTPYVVEVQGNHLSGLATRVVIPLRRLDRIAPVPIPPDLIPLFVIEGVECMLDTPMLAAIPRSALIKPITSLIHRQDEIISALDRLFGKW
ncbi:CcdB family protein [Trinickia fusca]|uniref:Toxin CcdB n=1 Tax=Trinickia fusca TaxID=2419777 RepID=A0A494XTD9_9BURK|nr:CcdB family protein [Trinickia fusca]RKP50793.1 plasmid maintenance protein CcdB [Trinickia fusca]